MSLRLIANNEDGTSRVLAAGAPPSPGPVPNDLAAHLVFGEALVWWGVKNRISIGPPALTLGIAAAVLGFVTLFVPELWAQGLDEIWPPLLAVFSPTLFVLVREWASQRGVLVTDGAIVSVDRRGQSERLPLHGIAMVRRDWLRGGVRLRGRGAEVSVPFALMEDARTAVASQLGRTVRASTRVDDTTGWMP
jgi:hypothetical protein